MNNRKWLASFGPAFDPVPFSEKLRSGLAAFAGILLLALALHFLPLIDFPPMLLGSMAAAATLLYAAPHSPMAQPWPLLAGNLLSGLIGCSCSLLIPDPILAAACAVGMAVFVMHLASCLHPPGGATALIMVLSAAEFHQHGWQWAALTVTANALCSLILALTINNLIPGRRYPMQRTSQPVRSHPAEEDVALEVVDIEWALTQMDGVIDVSEEDLLEIYELAVQKRHERNQVA